MSRQAGPCLRQTRNFTARLRLILADGGLFDGKLRGKFAGRTRRRATLAFSICNRCSLPVERLRHITKALASRIVVSAVARI